MVVNISNLGISNALSQEKELSEDQVSRGLEPTTSHSGGPHSTRQAIREIPTSQAGSSDLTTFWVLSHVPLHT